MFFKHITESFSLEATNKQQFFKNILGQVLKSHHGPLNMTYKDFFWPAIVRSLRFFLSISVEGQSFRCYMLRKSAPHVLTLSIYVKQNS